MPILIHVSVVLLRGDHLLLVQETKPENYGLWNLPGGHVEVGETLQYAACREALEETGLEIILTALVGIYTSLRAPDYHAIRFVFAASHVLQEARAGSDIQAVRWFAREELESLPDAELVGGARFRRILADIEDGVIYPLSVLK